MPITLRPPSPLSDDELLAFSHKNEPYRIEKDVHGDLVVMTPVGKQGGKREARVVTELMVWADQDGRGEANGPNAGWNLPDGSTLSPDASWTNDSRISRFTSEEQERYLPICPEFIIEVRSKSDNPSILRANMNAWLANGAQLAWMIDPYAATLTIYRPGCEPEVLDRPDSVLAEAPIEGFRLTTSNLWATE